MSLCCGEMPCVFLMGAQNVPTERGVAFTWYGFYPQDVPMGQREQRVFIYKMLRYLMERVLRIWVLCVPAEHIMGRKMMRMIICVPEERFVLVLK
jgi:hypothetical protein